MDDTDPARLSEESLQDGTRPATFATPPASRSSWLSAILRDRLITRGYRPGEWIREAPLQAEFGLSNGPVREALQSLVADGLLERVPYRGVRVRMLSDQDVLDLFEFRLAMMELAVEYAITRPPANLKARSAALIVHLESYRHRETPRLDGALSRWLLDAADNGRLVDSYRQIEAQAQIYVNEAAARPTILDDLIEGAVSVVRAVTDGDLAVALRACRRLTDLQLGALGIAMRLDAGDCKTGSKTRKRREQ